MNQKIMKWSSSYVYENALIADKSVENHTLNDLNNMTEEPCILMYIDTAGCEMYEAEKGTLILHIFIKIVTTLLFDDMNKSKFNEGEAGLVKVIVDELVVLGIGLNDIGVITPYSA